MNQPRLFNVAQHGTTSDDYWTPTWLFDLLGVTFDIDVACPPGGAPWVPARAYYTQEDDGLTAPWHGNVWMNPPFSSPAPWAWRFLEHGHGIALLPIGKSKWVEAVWNSAAELVYLPSNLKFQQGGIFIPTWLVAMGDDMIDAIRKVGRTR